MPSTSHSPQEVYIKEGDLNEWLELINQWLSVVVEREHSSSETVNSLKVAHILFVKPEEVPMKERSLSYVALIQYNQTLSFQPLNQLHNYTVQGCIRGQVNCPSNLIF